MRDICVYCSSSNHVHPRYGEIAERMGRLIADNGFRLVYGGGSVGLMGRLARAVHERNGHVYGVIPEALQMAEGVAYDLADDLVVTRTMQERKAIMYTRADAFVALPGGFGTLEEFLEVLTLKQLGYHQKPLYLVNAFDFYQPLLTLFEHLYAERFARENHRTLYEVVREPEDVIERLAEAERPVQGGLNPAGT
ncbi:MAG TPA: TIGR00730 family Rossman fold protein [Rhodothermales bacterium]